MVSSSVVIAQSGSTSIPSRLPDEIYIRNSANIRVNFSLKLDNGSWSEHSLNAWESATFSCSSGCDVNDFYVSISTEGGCSKQYRIPPGERNKIEWNSRERCWDFYKDRR